SLSVEWKVSSPEQKGGTDDGPALAAGRTARNCHRGDQPTISLSLKKNRISCAAVSGASEPCTELASMDSAKSARMVPGAASFGLVAPITSRFLATAFSPSRTCTTTGPEVMKVQRSLKKGRALCTA